MSAEHNHGRTDEDLHAAICSDPRCARCFAIFVALVDADFWQQIVTIRGLPEIEQEAYEVARSEMSRNG